MEIGASPHFHRTSRTISGRPAHAVAPLINMPYKFLGLLGLLLGAAFPAHAQNHTAIAATPGAAYGQDNQGSIARSQYGLCWRTGYWTPSDSLSGCDGG